MSKGRRHPLADAAIWAAEAVDIVTRHSSRVQVAGSIRRGRADVGDIDLVVMDEWETNPWQHSVIASALDSIGWVPERGGATIASFSRAARCGLDLYYATPETWGVTLLVRTGSAAHNIRLAQLGRHRAPARRLSVARGIIDTAGNVVASRSEDDIFRALGIAYIAPPDREAPDLEHLVGRGDFVVDG